MAVQVENVKCWRQGKSVEGTLHLASHHLIFHYPIPEAERNPESKRKHGESWMTYPMISLCTYRPSPPASPHPPSIRIQFRDFAFVAFHFLTDQEARSVYDSIKSLTCKIGRLDKLYAFTYHPHGLEKQINGWALYNPRNEFARLGISEKSSDKGWRITDLNADYSVCHSTCRVRMGTNDGSIHRHIRPCLLCRPVYRTMCSDTLVHIVREPEYRPSRIYILSTIVP
jgi:myotubularin-related protein 6/7/8